MEIANDEASSAPPPFCSYDYCPTHCGIKEACFQPRCPNFNNPRSVFCSAQCQADGLRKARATSESNYANYAQDPSCHICGDYDHVAFHCIFRLPPKWFKHARCMPTATITLRNLREALQYSAGSASGMVDGEARHRATNGHRDDGLQYSIRNSRLSAKEHRSGPQLRKRQSYATAASYIHSRGMRRYIPYDGE